MARRHIFVGAAGAASLLCAAMLLAHQGMRTVLWENYDEVGGLRARAALALQRPCLRRPALPCASLGGRRRSEARCGEAPVSTAASVAVL